MRPHIPDNEFLARIQATQKAMADEGIDLLLCFGNEAEPQFVRYYCDYWPSFESAGVLIPARGEPTVIIGPESGTYATHVSRIKKIRKLLAFRESSEPEYPGAILDTFGSVIQEAIQGSKLNTIGIVGFSLITHVIYDELEKALKDLGNPQIVKSDLLVSKIRSIKSANELACMHEAYQISYDAMSCVLDKIHAGMTENQVKGIALSAIYEKGGEGEAYPFWILSGSDSNQAISRCRNKVIQEGDIVQIQIGARYEGYASTVGRPVVIGKATEEQKKMIQAGYLTQKAILETVKPGVNAKEISEVHYNSLKSLGYDQCILYGPCHGTGLMEGEYPWVESNSDYIIQPDMTFCTCLYLGDDQKRIGIRIEDGFYVTAEGAKLFSDFKHGLIEIA